MPRGSGLATAEQPRTSPGQLELPDRAAPEREEAPRSGSLNLPRRSGLAPAVQARACRWQLALQSRTAPEEWRTGTLVYSKREKSGGHPVHMSSRHACLCNLQDGNALIPRIRNLKKGEAASARLRRHRFLAVSARVVRRNLPPQPRRRMRFDHLEPEEKPCEHMPHSASLPPCDHLVRATLRQGTQKVQGA